MSRAMRTAASASASASCTLTADVLTHRVGELFDDRRVDEGG